MTLQVRALSTKCGNLRLIPRNLMVEGKNQLLQVAFTHKHTHAITTSVIIVILI